MTFRVRYGFSMGYDYWGNHKIHGIASELDVPGRYLVRLYDRKTGTLLCAKWSDTEGSYVFDGLMDKEAGYFVIAFDHGQFPLNAAIADWVTPEHNV